MGNTAPPTMLTSKILLVEDSFDVAQNICTYLEASGNQVEWAPDGLLGLESATRERHDVIILDIALPGITGIKLCERLRALGYSKVPILMLTASGELEDKLAAFRAGADDYVVKPFALEELESRLHALRRRAADSLVTSALKVGELEYDVATQLIRRAGRAVQISTKGRQILELLMRNTHRVVSRQEIEQAVWGDDLPESDTLRIHIHALREAVDKPFASALIVTVRGSGYRLTDQHGDYA